MSECIKNDIGSLLAAHLLGHDTPKFLFSRSGIKPRDVNFPWIPGDCDGSGVHVLEAAYSLV